MYEFTEEEKEYFRKKAEKRFENIIDRLGKDLKYAPRKWNRVFLILKSGSIHDLWSVDYNIYVLGAFDRTDLEGMRKAIRIFWDREPDDDFGKEDFEVEIAEEKYPLNVDHVQFST